jgi:hypothetical protein
VQEFGWKGSGPEFTLFWGGRNWTLKVDDPCPSLCLEKDEVPPKLLSLDRLGRPGLSDLESFNGKTLVECERHRSSVRATFAPPSWGGLRLRASWTASAGDAVDLEIQISASSVGELDGLEVGVVSRLDSAAVEESAAPLVFVESRETGAPFSREQERYPSMYGSDVTTFSPSRPLRPCLYPAPGGTNDRFYVEMAHPDDLARRISTEPIPKRSATVPGRYVRYGLFGLAIEKGVILRARLRGCWIRSRNPEAEAQALYREFLHQPLPLGP